MVIARWDSPAAKLPPADKLKPKSLNACDEANHHDDEFEGVPIKEPSTKKASFQPKTPSKRKRAAEPAEEPESKRLDWIKEKAKASTIPDEKDATIKPAFIFRDNGPLIVHVCSECRKYNSGREPTTVVNGMVEIPLALCTVCRAHFNTQRSAKFFQFELPTLKKTYNL